MRKKVFEKFQTRLNNFLRKQDGFLLSENKILFNDKEIFFFEEVNDSLVILKYTKNGVRPTNIEPFYDIDYKLEIKLNHDNLNFLSLNLLRPLKYIPKIFNYIKDNVEVNEIIFGDNETRIEDGVCYVTNQFYNDFKVINDEESRDERQRVKTRINPFFNRYFNIQFESELLEKDYGVLLNEIIASESLTEDNIINITKQLKPGVKAEVVIGEKIKKQAKWLINILREIIDTPKLNQKITRELGNKHFYYPKTSIQGPEHLLEKILSDHGQNIIFGVPALLNTNKYVISERIASRVQFDLILIDELSDVQIVELKRPDQIVLDFDSSRNKFFPSKTLSVAIGQSERYISTILRENDEEYKIDGKKIREYIEENVAGITELFITRPTALIIIGRIQDLAKKYEDQTEKVKNSLTKKEYEKNLDQAYRELRSTHKNIKIITYSELINGAELRLVNNDLSE